MSETAATRPDPPRPVFVYDGDCGFCRCWIARWLHDLGDTVEFRRYQDLPDPHPIAPSLAIERQERRVGSETTALDRRTLASAAHLIEPGGRVFRGAQAVFRMFAQAGRKRWRSWAYDRIPAFAAASEQVYECVARRRSLLARFMHCGDDPANDPRGMSLTRWKFLRALAVVYFLAFASVRPQISGLVGHDGILPAQSYLDAVAAQLGSERYWRLPTLCWLGASDEALRLLCDAGLALSILLALDVAPALVLVLLWACYLSLVQVGGVFLGFQWDALLLETGLLAVFAAPLHLLPGRGRMPPAPSAVSVWLLRWLLFRLMFLSGVVKLISGDPTWRDLTALTVHYETQPLSNWVAWHVHQWPAWVHRASCAGMFAIEIGLALLIFAGRRARRIACAGFVLLQLLIIVTGNYGFFNLLTLALCVLLLDDGFWPGFVRRRLTRRGLRRGRRWPAWLTAPLAVVIVVLTLVPALGRLRVRVPWPEAVVRLYRAALPLDSFNAYGLFAAMTHTRPEIILEGSDDGQTWRAYEFRYKPGDPRRAPPYVAPHMPRLDWQMWFAALGSPRQSPWFFAFCRKLLEGSPSVLGLLDHNPFPDHPPRYIRAVLYEYRFTDRPTRAADGTWWRREYKGPFTPRLELEMFRRPER